MNSKITNIMALGYLLVPLLIFVVGYLKWYIAVGSVVIVVIAAWQFLHSLADAEIERNSVAYQPMLFGTAVIVAFLLGVGGYYTQSTDWMAKNPVLNDMVVESWPVIVRPQTMSVEIQQVCGSQSLGLVYYFFYYLPAVCVGKLAGIGAARFALFMWTVGGLYMLLNQLVIYVSRYNGINNRRQVALLCVLFVFWGGGRFFRSYTAPCCSEVTRCVAFVCYMAD